VKSGGAVPVQRGFALIALLALAALFAAFLIASTLDFTATGNAADREDRSMSALRKAKAALIAYAANEQWQLYKTQPTDQPGGLPCPDADDDGDSEGVCPNASDRVGRLPWTSIGADDLRDASGERLWYALSSNFRRLSGTTIINSDTPGLLTVTGAAPASNVVAVVIAPGNALAGQNRTGVLHNNPAAYLEGFTTTSPDYGFSTVAKPSETANDRLLVITQAELMAAVEPAVAARIERDIGKGLLQDYFNAWGRYPFAMPFASPPVAQSSYVGVSSPSPGTTMGLLPVTNSNTAVTWTATVTSLGTGTGRYTDPTKTITPNPTTCSVSAPPPPLTVTCTFSFNGCGSAPCDDRPDIKVEAFAANASMVFADKPAVPSADNLQIYNANFPRTLADDTGFPYGFWSTVGSFVPTMSFVLQTTTAVLTYTGRLQNSADMNQGARIIFQIPTIYLPRLTNASGTNPNIAWFIANQWYRQTYYAMALGYAPGVIAPGNPAACNPPTATAPPCLTVNNLPGTTNNKQAILIFAGRALDNQVHPSGTLSDYLEGQNATPADLIFEHRTGVSTTINDRVVVVSP
jgi:type II secretory pathway pseudopilin PulG